MSTKISMPCVKTPDQVKHVAIIGTGIIGSGWAAVFLARGYSVKAYIRSKASKDKFLTNLEDAWQKLCARGLAKGSHSVICTGSIQECVNDADYVQESVLEDPEMKQEILAEIEQHAPPGVFIATSSSYLPRSLCALKCQNPARIVTAHPSLPQWDSFVEVLGATSADTQWLSTFFSSYLLFDVVEMKAQYWGHTFNAVLMAALQEADALVKQGISTQEDVDKAVKHLGKLFVASEGVSGSLIGLVGGGYKQGFEDLATEVIVGAPLAQATSRTGRKCGEGCCATGLQKMLQSCSNWVFGRRFREVASKQAGGWANNLEKPWDAAVASAGSVSAARAKILRRMAAIETIDALPLEQKAAPVSLKSWGSQAEMARRQKLAKFILAKDTLMETSGIRSKLTQ